MVGIKMRVGPKGQVVIPQQLREEFNIMPGSVVTFDHTSEKISIEKQQKSFVETFKKLAGNIKKPVKIDVIHGIYEEYEQRWKRAKKSI